MLNYIRTVSCIYVLHACLSVGYADHPQDERLHHTITRTDERFDLWRIIIITKVFNMYEGIIIS